MIHLSRYLRLLLLCSLFVLLPVTAQVCEPGIPSSKEIIRNDKVRTAFYQGMLTLYSFRFSDTYKICCKLKQDYPDSPWGFVLESNYCWWKIISGENNPEVRKLFFDALNQSEIRTSKKNIDESLYCRIIINSLRSRFELLNKNYLKTLLILNKSKRLVQQMDGKENEYEPFFLTQGLFQYFIAIAKEKTGFISYLLHYKADKEKGLAFLNALTHTENRILRTESNYFLMKIFLEIEHDPVKAKPHADYLLTWYPENSIFCFYNQKVNTAIYGKSIAETMNSGCSGKPYDPSQLSESQINYLNFLSAQNK
ncbi:MAG: hypothetical protein AB9842_01970 [Bacteroidales bacterium]